MKNPLKIAIVAPPFGETGGPEVVVKNLTEALVEKGVDVTLFAPGDWKTKAKHIITIPKSLWNMNDFKDQTEIERRNIIIISQHSVLKHQKDFDIIHLHSQRYAASVAELADKPCVATLHNRIAGRDFKQIKKSGCALIAISEGRSNYFKGFSGVVSNGINVSEIQSSFKDGKHLMVLGRINRHKGFDLAVKIAQKTGKKLLIFGRIGDSNERRDYFDKEIKPYLNENIVYKGEASREEVFKYLKGAEALLSPIRTSLSMFPLVMMEALACGTPVIGSSVKPLPKKMLLEMKKVGCFSDDFNEWVKAVKEIDTIKREDCRRFAEDYFDNSVMADKYMALYRKVLNKSRP